MTLPYVIAFMPLQHYMKFLFFTKLESFFIIDLT
jgi:hypothetical protein